MEARGYIRIPEMGWVKSERVDELLGKKILSQKDGVLAFTERGVKRFNINALIDYLGGGSDLPPVPKPKVQTPDHLVDIDDAL